MADLFVDQSIVAGNGTDPASAFASILSVAWASGDRAWVRNNHFETIANSQIIGQNTPSAPGFSRWHNVIGWPRVGEPFYDERPARGITIGWDTDVASSVAQNTFGFNHATFMNSNGGTGAGMLLGYQTGFFNLCLCTSPGVNGTMPWNNGFGIVEDHLIDNCLVLATGNGFAASYGTKAWNAIVGTVIVVTSFNNPAQALIAGAASIRHLIVHSRGGLNAGLLTLNSGNYGMITNYSNSVAWLWDQSGTGFAETDIKHLGIMNIDKISGVRPFSGPSGATLNHFPAIRINDYFGEGPRIFGSVEGPNVRVTSSGEALHNALPVVRYDVASRTGNVNFGVWDARWRIPSMRKLFNVTSGTNVAIYVPIYVGTTHVFSPTGGQLRSYLQAKGAHLPGVCVKSTLIPGSYTNWTGSHIAGGSAWLWVSTFTPNETGMVAFDVHFSNFFQTASGNGIAGYALFGEPYAI
jgi:hypothetical protein